jgi:1-acyl-sn-glycerol-3-phosphate acyltransferase
LDIPLLCTEQRCAFVAKQGVNDVPIIGRLASFFGCIFVGGGGGERTGASRDITAYQSDLHEGKRDVAPLVVFPEGTTSNGTTLCM